MGVWRFVLWLVIGDHEHFCNTLRMPHWQKHKFCWECQADKRHALKHGRAFVDGTSGCDLKPVMSELNISNHGVYDIPGVTRHNTTHDAMHVLYVNGLGSHMIGSMLHGLVYPPEGRPRGQTPEERLDAIWNRIQELYSERDQQMRLTRMTNLTISMFTDKNAPFKSHPQLKCKGAECRHLLPIMAQISQECHSGSEIDEHRTKMLEAVSLFGDLMDRCGPVPTGVQATMARQAMIDVLFHSHQLRAHAEANDSQLWHIVYKHHFAEHLSEQFRWMNPRFGWCFKSEDFIGRISLMAHSTAFGTRSIDLASKIMEKWRLLL